MKKKWNLEHLYKNITLWKKDYKKIMEQLTILRDTKDGYINKIDTFLKYMNLLIDTCATIERVYCYSKRHLDQDFTQEQYDKMMKDALGLYNEYQLLNEEFNQVVVENEEKVKDYLTSKNLKKYERYIYLILRKKMHLITDSEQKKSYPDQINKVHEIKGKYQKLFKDEVRFEDVLIDGETKELNRTSYSSLIQAKTQEERKQVYDKYTKGFSSVIDKIADLYVAKLNNDISVSKLEKYDSLLDKKLFEFELPNTIVKNLIGAVNSKLDVMHKYIDFRIRESNLDEFHIYDTSVELCNLPKIQMPLKKSIEIIKLSLAPLGSDYIALIDRMFEEGWVDVYPAKNKRTMSFTAISYFGVPYIMINYKSSINSARLLAHEIGHSVHTHSSKTHNEFMYFEYSFFLAEIASKVNEVLVNEYMLNNCDSIEEKKYILNNVIGSLVNSIFNQVMLTEFEDEVITEISNKNKISTEYLNELYFKLSKRYNGSSIVYDDNVKYGWSKIPHFIMQETYYVYQYAIGTSIATNIATRILKNEKGFVDKYRDFLTRGNTVTIEEALALLDISLDNEKYISDAIDYLSQKIDELEDLCK